MKKLMLLAIVLAFVIGVTGCHRQKTTQKAAPAATAETATTAAPVSPTTAAPVTHTTPAK